MAGIRRVQSWPAVRWPVNSQGLAHREPGEGWWVPPTNVPASFLGTPRLTPSAQLP